ncbi:hypothetical protein G3N56_12095 [Desulfovibrio sulfodismutans]|uniref:DUF1795 domain-containing protein n=1 Tax=Desulfolutivibrio sulfodismutans TaxID=63561 RepID=A0A7K3NMP5_9BACT|nr:hypothetical protein [Desulfolutivibrio sulfodismutans]NDY57476.1 hypothetical protein [Desulfolutivibrio sulfodismutans]QLA14306.1 hypothetical protein GD606_19570 [Desulfolutivibrio sulfodismutans DSM 3696]
MRAKLTGCSLLATFAVVLVYCATAFAQLGFIQQGLDAVTAGKKPAAAPDAASPAASGGKVLTQDTTYTNAARNLQFTIPAGWEIVEGSPDSESVGFRNMKTTMGFSFHAEQMVPSFPRASAVTAGLKQDQERVTIKKLLSAKRRDDGDAKKKCGVIGWEIVEAPQKNDFQRIIWQCYDGQNFYMNIMAYSENKDFAASEATLRKIMDSVKFCK